MLKAPPREADTSDIGLPCAEQAPGQSGVEVNGVSPAGAIAQLRHHRREMRRELARVRWWRQLVKARRDLSIAGLADPGTVGTVGMDATWEALAADAPTSRELADAVWPQEEPMAVDVIGALDSLDSRLASYEARVSENLENVTAKMVTAMGHAHRAGMDTKEPDHA